MSKIWSLERQGAILGKLVLYSVSQPWFMCHYYPDEPFIEVASLFDEELNLLNSNRLEEWVQASSEIDLLGLRLVGEGEVINDFILHIDGGKAWFRY